jgi:hypothetical protein
MVVYQCAFEWTATMAWLWDSWDEYVKWCNPAGVQRGTFNISRSNTQLESAKHLLDAVEELTNETNELRSLGFKGNETKGPAYDEALVGKAWNHVLKVVYAGEELLIYHKRLALSEDAYGFLHQNSLLEHWDRYAGGPRIVHEIQQLVDDVDEMLTGYQRMTREDERLLLHNLDVPRELESDFRMARNLFSVGLDEVALFIAARGLERVLRQIAHDRKITLEVKGKKEPAGEADLRDLIETMSRVRWKVKRTPLISKETRTLLQYIRTVRNSGAHVGQQPETEDARQTASIIARSASRLWNSVADNRARLDPTNIPRNWS